MAIRVRVYPQPGSVGARRNRAIRRQQNQFAQLQRLQLLQQQLLQQQSMQQFGFAGMSAMNGISRFGMYPAAMGGFQSSAFAPAAFDARCGAATLASPFGAPSWNTLQAPSYGGYAPQPAFGQGVGAAGGWVQSSSGWW